MKLPLCVAACLWSLLAIGPLRAETPAAPSLRVGAAEADITPPAGYPVAGYYFERLATGVRDPLKAKAIVLQDGDAKAALVVCDLTGITVDLAIQVKQRAAAETGIPPECIAVSATHSHTAPDYARDLWLHLGDDAARKRATEYPGRLIASIAQAIIDAHAAATPAEIRTAVAVQQTPISFNRRFVMRDGSVRTWMSLDNPDVVRAAGPIDPEAAVAVAWSSADQRPLATISNFALHLDTVGGTQWSADYPFYVEQAVRKSLGGNVVSLFGTGCCGDINHVDPSRPQRNTTEQIGVALGETVQTALQQAKPIESSRLKVRSAVVRLPLQDASPEDMPRAKSLLASAKKGETVDFFDQVAAYKQVILDQLLRAKPTVDPSESIGLGLSRHWAGVGGELPVEVQVFALGRDLAIVTLPGEIFVDLGLAIKRASPFRQTMIVELSNCVETIYIPTRAAYAGGSYEVTNSLTQPGSGEMLVETALRLLREAASQ